MSGYLGGADDKGLLSSGLLGLHGVHFLFCFFPFFIFILFYFFLPNFLQSNLFSIFPLFLFFIFLINFLLICRSPLRWFPHLLS